MTTATSAAHFEISIFNSSIPKRAEYVKKDHKGTIYCVIIQKEARQREPAGLIVGAGSGALAHLSKQAAQPPEEQPLRAKAMFLYEAD